MKPTILDLLIVTCLSAENKAISLPFKLFDTYSLFVKVSPLFICTRHGNNITLTVQNWTDFRQKRSQWMSSYNHDAVIPFEENGFGAERIARFSSSATEILFVSEKLHWDLAQNKCYIQSQIQNGTGICWAWDWFAISRILDRIRSISWDAFTPDLTARNSSCVTLSFSYRSTPSMPVLVCKQQAYLALHARSNWCTTYGPFKMTSRSKYILLKNKPLKLGALEHNMLTACMDAKEKGLTFGAAFLATYGKRRYKPNNTTTSDEMRVSGKWSKKLKIKALQNTRFRLQRALDSACVSNNVKRKAYISTKGKRIKLIY